MASDRETSIRRGIEVLLSLGSAEAIEQGGMGVTRISETLGREKSQVSRALKALAEYGLVERNRDALTYRLGWRIYALAQLAGEPRLLEETAPRLQRLAAETQERAHFSVLQGPEVLTLAPRRRTLSSFTFAEVAGITTQAGMPRRLAA